MHYAKLINNEITFYRPPISVDGKDIFTSDPTPYGYKQFVREAPEEREGYYAVEDGYEETETQIKVKYRYVEEPDDVTPEEFMQKLEAIL